MRTGEVTRGEGVAYAPLNANRSNRTLLRIRRATTPIMHGREIVEKGDRPPRCHILDTFLNLPSLLR
jgi:hypothetical protein